MRQPCSACGTLNGYTYRTLPSLPGQHPDDREVEEIVCNSGYHDKDRDPFRYGYPDDDTTPAKEDT